MTLRLTLLSAALLAAAALSVPAPVQAIQGLELCRDWCDHTPATCLDPCRNDSDTATISCMEYFGPDHDGDGVANSIDNCACNPNSDQANCDGDSLGDVCDPNNARWVRIQDNSAICHIDSDSHTFYRTTELYSSEVYQNDCGGGTCVKNIFEDSWNCTQPITAVECCERHFPAINCLSVNDDNCGTPKCPF